MRTRLIFCHQISLKFFIRWTKDKTFIFWYISRRHWRWQSPVFDRKIKASRHSHWFEHRHVHTSLMLFTSQLKTLTFVDAEHEENILTERKNTFLTFLINFKILHVKKNSFLEMKCYRSNSQQFPFPEFIFIEEKWCIHEILFLDVLEWWVQKNKYETIQVFAYSSLIIDGLFVTEYVWYWFKHYCLAIWQDSYHNSRNSFTWICAHRENRLYDLVYLLNIIVIMIIV